MMNKPYPKYKPSGVAWLGDVPEHWGIKKVQFLLENNDGGVWGEDPIGDDNDSIVLRSTEQTVDGFWKIEDPAIRYLTDQEIRKAHLVEGDLVITKASGSEQHIGKTSLVNTDIEAKHCCFSNFMQRLRPNARTSSLFLWFYFNNRIVREQFVYYSNTTTGLANLNPSLIGDVQISLPPLPEQQAIAAFLDREAGRIDALISKKERLLELLAEQRTALISRAVTKGLDASVKMKPSGVEWLGDVPEHWEVKRYKNAFTIFQGMAFKSSDYVDVSDVICIRMGNIKKGGSIDLEHNTKYLPDEYAAVFREYILKENDLIIAMTDMSPSLDFLAVPAIITGLDESSVYLLNQRVGKLIINKRFILEYVKYLLLSKELRDQLKAMGLGTVQSNMSSEDLYNAFFASPPLPEQQAIAAFLDRETAKIDALSVKVSTVIERLKEYRTALISSAVTGKIDVREAV